MTLKPYSGLRLIIYQDPTTRVIRYEELAKYLQGLIPRCTFELREDFLSYACRVWGVDRRRLARAIASARVIDLISGEPVGEPLPGEVAFEERMLTGPARRVGGVIFEGYLLQRLLQELIPPAELRYGTLHTVLSPRLLATKEPGEGRAHARTIILGCPVLISTSGLIEAPALPPEIYLRLQMLRSPDTQQLILEEEKQRRRENILTYDDERMTEVLKGYVLMGVFYYLFGEAFCGEPRCRLFNAHTHEELVEAQLRSGRLCGRHEGMLRRLEKGS